MSVKLSTLQSRYGLKPVHFVIFTIVLGFVARLILVNVPDTDLPYLNWFPWLNRTSITFYYADDSGKYLIPVSQTIDNNANSHQTVIDTLMEDPKEGRGLVSIIPRNMEFLSTSIDENIVTVDITLSEISTDLTLPILAIRYSFQSLPEVDGVIFTIDGNPMDSAISSSHLAYYIQNDLFVAIPTEAGSPEVALNEYMARTNKDGLVGLPSDVHLLDYDVNSVNGLMSLNFTYTDSIRELGIEQPETMRQVLIGLIATMTQFPEITAVSLNFEDHARLGFGQCADLLRSPQIAPIIFNDRRLVSN